LVYACISAGSYLGRDPSSNFRGVHVRDVVGDFIENTMRFRIEESVAESVCDAVKEELCIMIVREGPVP
jgi:hypothetical protein